MNTITKLPENIDREVSKVFGFETDFGYQIGFDLLKQHMSEEDALFSTFCHFLLSEKAEKSLTLGSSFLTIIENTFVTSFGKDYRYKVELAGRFMDHDFIGENEIYVGEFSRYKVGLGVHLDECVECFARKLGRYDGTNFTGLVELNFLPEKE